MDIIRNIGVRETIPNADNKTTENEKSSVVSDNEKGTKAKTHRNSMPNIVLKNSEVHLQALNEATALATNNASTQQELPNRTGVVECASSIKHEKNLSPPKSDGVAGDEEEECAISGRLEIRVIQQNQNQALGKPKNSPNPEESIYFDAVPNGASSAHHSNQPLSDDNKVSRKTLDKTDDKGVSTDSALAGSADVVDSTKAQAGDNASLELKKCFVVTSNEAPSVHSLPVPTSTAANESNNSTPNSNYLNDGDADKHLGGNGVVTTVGITDSSMNDDNAAEVDTFISAATTLAKLSNVMDNEAVNASAICNANDSLSNDNKEFPVVSYSLYPNQSSIEQNDLSTKPVINQSDGTVPCKVSNQNNKKDTNSKIPVFNPNVRMMKCASWAGNDLPLTTADINDLTPGMYSRRNELAKTQSGA